MLDKGQFISGLKEKLKLVNPSIENGELVDFMALEMADRLSLYLNLDTDNPSYDERLVSIATRVSNNLIQEVKDKVIGADVMSKVQSVSDNGQTVNFTNITKNYVTTALDSELFEGVANILKPYRRCNVVS